MVLQGVIAVHIAAGLTAVISGAVAMFAPKRRGRHPRAGHVYLLAQVSVAATAVLIVTARPHTAYLLILGSVAVATASCGYAARRIRWRGWLRYHISGMGLSYIALLTAFYVDNGPRLPVWSLLPPITFWFLPSAVGLPLLIRALLRNWIGVGHRKPAAIQQGKGL
ncbi:MAG: DUF2306 domain-containing protein [Propionibacteriales bacterium]|nr:DUF2306 domain-containing protein [Propionibacteriales bacterium]